MPYAPDRGELDMVTRVATGGIGERHLSEEMWVAYCRDQEAKRDYVRTVLQRRPHNDGDVTAIATRLLTLL